MEIKSEGIILKPTEREFEKTAVLNPAVIKVGDEVRMYYRAVDGKRISSIGFCRLDGNKVVERYDHPVIFPEFPYETQGVEDPRVILMDGVYYIFYTAYDGEEAMVAYAVSRDMTVFEKKGLITPKITWDEAEDIYKTANVKEEYRHFEAFVRSIKGNRVLLWEKDACIFPKKINGKYAMLHRIMPGMQIIYFDDFGQLTDDYWREYLKNLGDFIIMDPMYPFETNKIGLGSQPIETSEGWLLITQGVEDTRKGLIYHASAALLDLKNPLKVIGRMREPLFSPGEEWEKEGFVNNVVFPSGALVEGDKLTIYYGAADSLIAAKSLSLSSLLGELKNSPPAR